VLVEVLTNADLLATLRAVFPAAPVNNPTDPPARPKGLFRRAWDKVQAGLAAVGTAGTAVLGQVAGVKTVARSARGLTKRFKGRVLAACGVGVAAGVATYLAGPWLGVAAGWLSGFAVSLAVQARNALHKLFAPSAAFA
jgi:hypothetical protein